MFTLTGHPENKVSMAKYMKNRFIFLGVKTPERRAQSKAFIQQSKHAPLPRVLKSIAALYQQPEREYQYVATDLALANGPRFSFTDMVTLTKYVQLKPWWDTVDAWRKLFDVYTLHHPDEKQRIFALFYQHPDFWMRRVAITLQLLQKARVDTRLLTQAITYDVATDESFIQKAIGWALRDYSKYDPAWVAAFIADHRLSPLAVKEGSKFLVISHPQKG